MLEMWDLYNGKREKTGKVLPCGVPVPKGLYHLTVSAWIVNSQGQYLLSRRHPQKTYPDSNLSNPSLQFFNVILMCYRSRSPIQS